jgi:hypothetical protein
VTRLFGPMLGEAGWEWCAWIPRVRHMVTKIRCESPSTRVAIIAPEGSRCLYEFADEFVPLSPLPGTSDFLDGDADPIELSRAMNAVTGHLHQISPTIAITQLERQNFRLPYGGTPDPMKEWRSLRTVTLPLGPHAYDVALAFRGEKIYRGKLKPNKAYPLERATRVAAALLANGYSTVAIGGADNLEVPCTRDMRGAPLAEQIDTLSRCAVAVGPSSAPLHLAQLCEVGVITWYGLSPESSRVRYGGVEGGWWNPFGAPCTFLEGLHPNPEHVVDEVQHAVEQARRGRPM